MSYSLSLVVHLINLLEIFGLVKTHSRALLVNLVMRWERQYGQSPRAIRISVKAIISKVTLDLFQEITNEIYRLLYCSFLKKKD